MVGLVDHIEDACERFAAEGFAALAREGRDHHDPPRTDRAFFDDSRPEISDAEESEKPWRSRLQLFRDQP